jgi:antitoxin FitA
MRDFMAAYSSVVVNYNTMSHVKRQISAGWFTVAIFAVNASIDCMATLTIRQLDEKTKLRLRIRAAHHGRSMEEEAREILRSAVLRSSPPITNLAEAIRRRFGAFGGLELELPHRDPTRHSPDFSE